MVIHNLSEMQAALLRTADPMLKNFGVLVDQIRAKLVTHKFILTRKVVAQLASKLIPAQNAQTTLIGIKSLESTPFYDAELKKIGKLRTNLCKKKDPETIRETPTKIPSLKK